MLEGQGIEPGSLASLGRQPKVGQGSTKRNPGRQGRRRMLRNFLGSAPCGSRGPASKDQHNGWMEPFPRILKCALPLGRCKHYIRIQRPLPTKNLKPEAKKIINCNVVTVKGDDLTMCILFIHWKSSAQPVSELRSVDQISIYFVLEPVFIPIRNITNFGGWLVIRGLPSTLPLHTYPNLQSSFQHRTGMDTSHDYHQRFPTTNLCCVITILHMMEWYLPALLRDL